MIKQINSSDSKIFFGSINGKVRRSLDKESFLFKIAELFPHNMDYLLDSDLIHAWKSSSMKNDTFEEFIYYLSILTTRQMSFFIYKKYFNENDICYETSTPYNKYPNKYNWYLVGKKNILLYKPEKHLKYLKNYILFLKK